MARYVLIGLMALFVGGLSFMVFPTVTGGGVGALIGAGIGWLMARDRGGGGQAGGAGAEDRPGRASADRADGDGGGGGEGG